MKFVRYFLISVVCLISGIIYAREAPKLKAWILHQIQMISSENLDLEINAKGIHFKLFPLGIALDQITMRPKKALAQKMAPAKVESLQISLALTSLFAGRLEVGSLTLIEPETSFFIRKDSSSVNSPSKKFELPWDQIMGLPIHSIHIVRGNFQGLVEPADLAISLKGLSLNLSKNFRALKLEIFEPEILTKRVSAPDSLTSFGIATRIIVEKNAAEIAALKISQGKNFLIARGVVQGAITKFDWAILNGRSIAHLNLEEVGPVVSNIFPDLTLPKLGGDLNFEVTARHQRGRDPIMTATVETKNTKISKFLLGDIFSKVIFTSGTLSTDEIKLTSNAGVGRIQNVNIKMGNEVKILGRLNIDGIELSQLLINLGVDENPNVRMDIKGRIPCEGTLKPLLALNCAGEVMGSDFRVFSQPENKTVVALQNFRILGNLTLDKEKITFPRGLISIGSSQGQARGQVDFNEGFNFSYHTDHLAFSDVKSLGDLKFIGGAEITGTTQGTSKWGIIDAFTKPKEFWFEDYAVGNGAMNVHYEKGALSLTDIVGQIGSTEYRGKTTIQLSGEKGIVSHLEIPKMDIQDLVYVFSKKVQLPFEASGPGSAVLDVSGPLVFSQLTYNLKSHFRQGAVAGESFKDLIYNVHADHGHVFADDVEFRKGDGRFTLTGEALSNGNLNVAIAGRGLHLGDFETVKSIATGIDGHLNVEISMQDYILKPSTTITGVITQTTLNQEVMEDSNFNILMSPDYLRMQAQIFAQKLRLKLVYPLSDKGNFGFKFDTVNWDFSNLLGLAAKGGTRHDYETALTARIDLQSEHGGFWNSTGVMDIPKLYVRHGTSQMRNSQPILVRFDSGLVNVEKLQVEGDNTQLSVTGSRQRNDVMNFNINGRIDLTLLTFLTPFFKDMTGQLSLSTQLAGTTAKPDLLGSAFIQKGYFKLDALSHPFEDINADFLFSQSRALLNRFSGNFGGGKLTCGGSIQFKGYRDFPVDLSGDLTSATLNIPEGLTTRGSGHFVILGNWFPYLLRADYNIDSGLMTKNFADENNDPVLKRSVYLPKVILKKDFYPLEVDLNTHFPKNMIVRNALMDSEVRGDLNIKGQPDHPLFKGDVEAVPNGKLFFRETPFTIQAARAKFSNPNENAPTIYALGTTRVRDWDISLLVQGTQKYKIELTSSPPLPEQKIVSLLALGLTEDTLDKADANSQQAFQASTAGDLLLSQSPQFRALKKKFGVNVRLSQTVDETKNVVLPRVIAEKQWTPQISTSISRTLGDQVTRDVNVEYKLNRHFSVLGSYEGRDYDPLAASSTSGATNQPQQNVSTDIFGLDLQYQVEFR